MDCHLEAGTKCGAGWRNSVFLVGAYEYETDRVKRAQDAVDSVKGIIEDITESQANVKMAHKLASQLAYLTAGDKKALEHS